MSAGPWLGLLLAGVALAPGGGLEVRERELFDAAQAVLLGKVVHRGGNEQAPGSTAAAPYRYQVLWVQDVEVFKGGPAPERYGYRVVMLPLRSRWHSPGDLFRRRQTDSTLPEDPPVLLYLTRDRQGAWVILDGPEGLWRYPGKSRLEDLRRWAKETPKG